MLLVFGQLFLWIALLLAAVSAVTFFLGAARRDDLAARAGRDSLTGSLLALCGATAILVAALVRHDFTFLSVAQNSDLRLLPVYQVSALWAGAEGSLLLWTLLATVAAVMFTRNGADDRRGAVAGGVLATVLVMFLVVLNAASTPFSPTYPVPWDGEGLKLPLQTWAMIAHPPILFAGYALLAVPFALALANLVCARLAADLETVRKFLIGGWMFLTAGIALGAWWAYTDLGWGGYWAWDPVENASLIPWLLATAALHTLAVSQRQGRLLRTTLSLLVATFLACVLATYITRGGVVQSIHGYAAGGLASVYPIFIGLAALATVVLLVRRRPAAGNEKTGTVPIAVALAALLAAFAVAILSGTVGPQILSELTGRRYGLGIEDFNRIAAVFGVLILLTLGGHFVLRRLGKVARGGGGIRSAARVLAHLALVILIIAIAASQWLASDQTVSLTVGQTAEFDGRQVSLDDLTTDTTPDGRTVITRAVVSLQRGNEPAVVLKPARLASTVNDQARAEVAVHSGCWEDLYVSLNGTGPAEGQASLTLHRAAGMLWLWIGAGLLVVAGAVALFGRRTRTAIPTASFSLLPFTFLLFPFLVAAPPAPESPTPPKNITIEARVVVVTGSAGQTSPPTPAAPTPRAWPVSRFPPQPTGTNTRPPPWSASGSRASRSTATRSTWRRD
jgi:cytochrome c biogenesis factor